MGGNAWSPAPNAETEISQTQTTETPVTEDAANTSAISDVVTVADTTQDVV